jgi:hypothetical protein
MHDSPNLDGLERELLDICGVSGETTTRLDEEMLDSSPGRATVEAALRSLVARGLMTTVRGTDSGLATSRLGIDRSQPYEDDWWDATEAGRAAVGLRPTAEAVEVSWLNPSKGPWRVSPLIAPWCSWRFRHGKEPVPGWYQRLTRKPRIRA